MSRSNLLQLYHQKREKLVFLKVNSVSHISGQRKSGSGSGLSRAFEGITLSTTLVPTMHDISFSESEIDPAFTILLNEAKLKNTCRFTDAIERNKLLEFKRMNNVLKMIVVDAGHRDIVRLLQNQILTSIFCTYFFPFNPLFNY